MDLDEITDAIHDRWFDVEQIDFDRDARILRVFFSDDAEPSLVRSLLSKPHADKKARPRVLEIHNVDSYRIQDTERVGAYDFNKLRYAPGTGTVSVETGVPLEMVVTVSDLEVVVRDL